MNFENTISMGTLAAVALEGIKWLVRKWKKNPTYDFPAEWYAAMIVVLNVALTPIAALLQIPGYSFPTNSADWLGWLNLVLLTIASAFAQLVVYSAGIKPLKNYAKEQAALP